MAQELSVARFVCQPWESGVGYVLNSVGAIRQIEITRTHKTGGFTLWSFRPQYPHVFPRFGMGITAPR